MPNYAGRILESTLGLGLGEGLSEEGRLDLKELTIALSSSVVKPRESAIARRQRQCGYKHLSLLSELQTAGTQLPKVGLGQLPKMGCLLKRQSISSQSKRQLSRLLSTDEHGASTPDESTTKSTVSPTGIA